MPGRLIREINNLKDYFDPANYKKKVKMNQDNILTENKIIELSNMNMKKSKRGRRKKIAFEINTNSNNNLPKTSSITLSKSKLILFIV
jgi:hypothetical protein